MTAGMTSIGNVAGRVGPVHPAVSRSHPLPIAAGRPNTLAAWLALIGIILPAWEMHVYIAGAKFTAGRMGVVLLFLPALGMLCQRGRRTVLSDLFAFLTAAWILCAAVYTSGASSISSAGAESLEFIASYVVGRAFFFGPAALNTFVRALKVLATAAIILALVDVLTGRWAAHDVAAAMFGTSALGPVFREGVVRATSTFDHPILFGTFCSLISAIFLFWEANSLRRIIFVALCFVGCVVSRSSAALMCFMIIIAAYAYNNLMFQIRARWVALWTIFAVILAVIFLVSEHPIGWVISHLTLDPVTGYYRILIWDAALDRISQSPVAGFSLQLFNQNILDSTVDCVWLVVALRFGIPTSIFLFLTNVTACLPAKRSYQMQVRNTFSERMSLAFTVVLLMFMFAGLTVHFWNYMWIFWGVCIGIRASLREMALGTTHPVLE
ncbi:hypothetical protein V1282_002385 [Nitrobacteraceae bacterium AZCC 2146]